MSSSVRHAANAARLPGCGSLCNVPNLAVSLLLHDHELLSGSVAADSLEQGHQSPLLLGDTRGVLVVIEVV
jgi:hypothetical protein